MPKMKQTLFSRDDIQKVLDWQLETVNLALCRGMLDATLAQLQTHQLREIARQFDIELATNQHPIEQPQEQQPVA